MTTVRERFEALIDELDAKLAEAFRSCIDDIRSEIVLRIVVERLEKGDVQGALDAMQIETDAFGRLERAIAEAYDAGGQGAVTDLPRLTDPQGARVVFRFGVRNLEAEAWLRQHSAELVTRVIEDQRVAIREALQTGLSEGRNPRSTALDVVGRVNRATGKREGGIIGLTSAQARYVEAARAELLSGDPTKLKEYLQRQRRDKRFDRAVMAAIRTGKPVDANTVVRATARYSDRLVALRGEMLARSETMTALGRSRDDAIRQQIAAGKIDARDVTKIWRATKDKRTRDTHRILDGQKVALDAAFHSVSGAVLRYPGDAQAPASEIIGCRCYCEFKIDYLARVVRATGSQLEQDRDRDVAGLRRQIESEIVSRGRAEVREFAGGYDEITGKRVATVRGDSERVRLSEEMAALARDPRASLVLYHTHPNDSPLSRQDLLLLAASPGLRRLHALGDAGSRYAASSLKALSEAQYDSVRSEVRVELRKALSRDGLPEADAIALATHAINLSLARLGFIDYDAELNGDRAAAYGRQAASVEAIVSAVTQRLQP